MIDHSAKVLLLDNILLLNNMVCESPREPNGSKQQQFDRQKHHERDPK
jgi:hypothetical protein